MIKKYILVSFLFLFAALIGCNENEISKIKNNKIVNIKGKLTLVGNAPFEKIALHFGQNSQVFLVFKTNKELKKAKSKLGKSVKIKGKFQKIKLDTPLNKASISEYRIIVNKIKYNAINL